LAALLTSSATFTIVFTNRGRSVLFGCYTHVPRGAQIERIQTRPQTESRIFFNELDSIPAGEVRYMSLDGPHGPTQRPYLAKLVSPRSFRSTQYSAPWFFSSCDLQGDVEMTLCKDLSPSLGSVLGMLLQYHNGHRAGLGQFRFDMALETISVEHLSASYIGSARTNDSFV
jgi:hypothetical protein